MPDWMYNYPKPIATMCCKLQDICKNWTGPGLYAPRQEHDSQGAYIAWYPVNDEASCYTQGLGTPTYFAVIEEFDK